jgi:hypothetical protein
MVIYKSACLCVGARVDVKEGWAARSPGVCETLAILAGYFFFFV